MNMKLRSLMFCVLLCCLFTVAVPVHASNTQPYVVQPGDTLYSLARRYGVNVQTLAAANGLTTNSLIYVGQTMTIPGQDNLAPSPPATSPGTVYVVRAGDTLMTIALRHGVSPSELAAVNGLRWNAWVYIGQRLTIPGSPGSPPAAEPIQSAPADGIHTVQPGENLYRIGLKYGTSANAIRAANNLSSNIIYVGQRLAIPGSGSPVTPAPAPAPPVVSPGGQGERWIDVNLSTQRITAYQGQTPVYSALVSTGLPGTPTVVGTFSIYVKYLSAPMSGPGYYLPNVPHTMYFYRGFALHGAYWHNNFGHPMSHGCVNLSLPDAEWFYNWASVGTKVVTHY
jgi:LysM repeat protein